jgi:hypothetical protein
VPAGGASPRVKEALALSCARSAFKLLKGSIGKAVLINMGDPKRAPTLSHVSSVEGLYGHEESSYIKSSYAESDQAMRLLTDTVCPGASAEPTRGRPLTHSHTCVWQGRTAVTPKLPCPACKTIKNL